MAKEIKILHEGHEFWETLCIRASWETWEIQRLQDGNVEISCDSNDGFKSLFLSQDELIKVIKFLQKKVNQYE